MATTKEKIYRDFPFTFTPHPVTGKVNLLNNERSVENALKNLIRTNKFEKPYEPLFGGNVTAYLFENLDQFTLHKIKKRIDVAIKNFEPRVDIEEIKADKAGEQTLSVSITYRITNMIEPKEVSFIVENVR